ncbi:YceI family protein [Streptacidiphilus monticola]|uniref:YceI family protein n=1 Tax=Streptacidiphilus monticola TaxID=2161674 RepID=A0ABW1FUI0_9ACTN
MTTQQQAVEAAVGTWTLDADASSIGLRTKSVWGLVKVTGRFGVTSGHGTVAPDGTVTGELVVDAASIDTANAKRDEHLRSAHFFDTANHPAITYRVNGVTPTGNGLFSVRGTLTVRDTTGPLPFTATAEGVGSDAITLTAEVPVDRRQFGVSFNQLGMMANDNVLTVTAVFRRA